MAYGTGRATRGIENGAPAADADVLGAGWEAGSINTSETGVSSAFTPPAPTYRNPGSVRSVEKKSPCLPCLCTIALLCASAARPECSAIRGRVLVFVAFTYCWKSGRAAATTMPDARMGLLLCGTGCGATTVGIGERVVVTDVSGTMPAGMPTMAADDQAQPERPRDPADRSAEADHEQGDDGEEPPPRWAETRGARRAPSRGGHSAAAPGTVATS